MEIFLDVPVLGRMANEVGAEADEKVAPAADDVAGCGSRRVAAALETFATHRTTAFTLRIADLALLGTAMIETANDFSETDAEVAAGFDALDDGIGTR